MSTNSKAQCSGCWTRQARSPQSSNLWTARKEPLSLIFCTQLWAKPQLSFHPFSKNKDLWFTRHPSHSSPFSFPPFSLPLWYPCSSSHGYIPASRLLHLLFPLLRMFFLHMLARLVFSFLLQKRLQWGFPWWLPKIQTLPTYQLLPSPLSCCISLLCSYYFF